MRMRYDNPESGFTMIMTILAMSLIMTLAVVAVAAVDGDVGQQHYDLTRKQAYEAAKAGVEDYAFHLKTNSAYWESCANVEEPSAVNQQGSTTKRRSVPGSGGATYAIELLVAENQTTKPPYTACSTANPQASMLEASGTLVGSFRIRSTGFAGKSKVSIVATFKRPSFLDYVYFTQYETLDPVAYASSSWLPAAYEQCEKTIQEGRYASAIAGSGGKYCSVISFINGEEIKGPLHTNDAIVVCGSPIFGRNASDSIEVGASSPGWYAGTNSILGPERPSSSNCGSANPTFKGTFKTNSPALEPPATNSELASIAEAKFKYTGAVRICLNGTTMTVGKEEMTTVNGKETAKTPSCTGLYSGPIPSNGVIYVSNGSGCSSSYSPFTVSYTPSKTTVGCGTAFVQGNYSGPLTIAAENDIVINGNLTRSGGSESALLGLIANNFVRVYHAYPSETTSSCGSSGGEERLTNLKIEAAILAINHSFIVDHYDCGSAMGTLALKGAVAQKFRGPVGTFSGSTTVTGYTKNYEYDDRLRYTEPPSFLNPVTKSWVIGRETLG